MGKLVQDDPRHPDSVIEEPDRQDRRVEPVQKAGYHDDCNCEEEEPQVSGSIHFKNLFPYYNRCAGGCLNSPSPACPN